MNLTQIEPQPLLVVTLGKKRRNRNDFPSVKKSKKIHGHYTHQNEPGSEGARRKLENRVFWDTLGHINPPPGKRSYGLEKANERSLIFFKDFLDIY